MRLHVRVRARRSGGIAAVRVHIYAYVRGMHIPVEHVLSQLRPVSIRRQILAPGNVQQRSKAAPEEQVLFRLADIHESQCSAYLRYQTTIE